MTFRMIVQLWKSNTKVIVSRDTGLTETPCTFQWILEWKLVYLIVLASVQFAISCLAFFLCNTFICKLVLISLVWRFLLYLNIPLTLCVDQTYFIDWSVVPWTVWLNQSTWAFRLSTCYLLLIYCEVNVMPNWFFMCNNILIWINYYTMYKEFLLYTSSLLRHIIISKPN